MRITRSKGCEIHTQSAVIILVTLHFIVALARARVSIDYLRGEGVPLLLDGRSGVRNATFVAAGSAEPERVRARAQPQSSTAE